MKAIRLLDYEYEIQVISDELKVTNNYIQIEYLKTKLDSLITKIRKEIVIVNPRKNSLLEKYFKTMLKYSEELKNAINNKLREKFEIHKLIKEINFN